MFEKLDSKNLIKLPDYSDLVDSIFDLYDSFELDQTLIDKEFRKELEVLFLKLKKLIAD